MWHVSGKRNGYIDTPEEKRPKEYLGVGGRIILKHIFKKGVDWINLAQVGASGGLF
jgi:hypothetical protein